MPFLPFFFVASLEQYLVLGPIDVSDPLFTSSLLAFDCTVFLKAISLPRLTLRYLRLDHRPVNRPPPDPFVAPVNDYIPPLVACPSLREATSDDASCVAPFSSSSPLLRPIDSAITREGEKKRKFARTLVEFVPHHALVALLRPPIFHSSFTENVCFQSKTDSSFLSPVDVFVTSSSDISPRSGSQDFTSTT